MYSIKSDLHGHKIKAYLLSVYVHYELVDTIFETCLVSYL